MKEESFSSTCGGPGGPQSHTGGFFISLRMRVVGMDHVHRGYQVVSWEKHTSPLSP